MDKIKKTIQYLFYAFVFFLPWQTRYIYNAGELNGGLWEYGMQSLYAVEILLFLCIAVYVFASGYYLIKTDIDKSVKAKNNFFNIKTTLPAVLFLLWAGISVFWSADRTLAWYRWIILLQGIIVFLFLAAKMVSFVKTSFFFVSGAFIQAILGIYQFVVQGIAPNKWLGIASHYPSSAGVSVVETSLRRWLRAYGAFPHPNILAAYLGAAFLVFVIFLASVFVNRGSLNSLKSMARCEWRKFVMAFLAFIFGLAVLLSFSRAVWLGLIISLAALLVSAFLSKKIKQIDFINLPAFGFIVLFFITLFLLKNPLLVRVKGEGRLEQKSNIERLSSYSEGWSIIKDNWFLGAGLGNYTFELYKKNPASPSWSYQPVHNLFVMVFAELGIIGLIIFIIFVVFAVRAALNNPMSLSFFIFLVFISLFDHYFWTLYTGVILWWLGMGLIFSYQEKKPN